MNINIKSGLYIIATPIGNLQDITLRALEILRKSDIIFCEDTRVTLKLLSTYDIKVNLKTYNDYSTQKDREYIKKLLLENKIIALVSDAGTPLISDPGYKLIEELKKEELYFTSIPGPSSVLTALTLSNLPCDKFSFYGFIPQKALIRKKFLEEKKFISNTMIFFETPHRLVETLSIINEIYQDRKIVIARELTKKFEEVKEGTAKLLINYFQNNPLKGEIVLLVEGFSSIVTENTINNQLKIALKYTNVKTASLIISELQNINKNVVYKQALELKQMNE